MPNDIDRNASTQQRCERNWQRLVEGAATKTIKVAPPLFNNGGVITLEEVTAETPSGAIDGTNVTFTLAHQPVSGTEKVLLNGQRIIRGGSDDYTISNAVITFLISPKIGDKIRVDYDRAS